MQMQFMASWSPMRRWLHAEPSAALPSHEDLSMPYNFTDTSSQTCVSMDSSSTTTDISSKSHMWNNHLHLLNSGVNMQLDDDLNNSGDQKFLELLSSKTLPSSLFSDYSKDVDNNLGLAHSMNQYNGITQSYLSSWSIAPTLMAQNVMPNPSLTKSMTCYNYDLKEEKPQPELFVLSNEHPIGSGATSVLGLNNHKLCNEMIDTPWSCSRNLADLISFDGCLNSSSTQTISQRVDSKKSTASEISSARPTSSRSSAISTDNKKRKSEDNSEANSKKPKQQSSTTASKAQVPKVKVLDKISALQQIVSPFGKTDTASVLLDTYKYIKILHEQIQLLSDPFIKSSCGSKDHNAIWGGRDAREKAEQDVDLRCKGLCLIPVSYAPQVCQDNGTPDYWTPPYRSCLFR